MLQIPKPTRRGLVVVLAFALLAGVVPATLRPLTASASTASQSDSTETPSSQTADASTTPDANATANTSITPTVSYGTSSAGGSFAPSVTYGTSAATTSPSAPLSLAATPGSTTITLTWSTPQSDGGSAVTQYNVEKSTDGAAWSTAATVLATSALTTTLAGLTNGTAYYVRVSATNVVGTGPASSTTVTPSTNASSPLTPGQGTVPIPAGGYPAAVAADSPVGYWKLDEAAGAASAVDSSGNGLNGSPTAVTFGAANSSPLGGSAATFNGTSSQILLPRSPMFVSGPSTFEAWVNPSSTAAINMIYSRGQRRLCPLHPSWGWSPCLPPGWGPGGQCQWNHPHRPLDSRRNVL
ncbi:MAG: fibronectin type III domain-containing protein [Actinobacteria bacterium]|nr:fibronectin type III domain-containing protein [Actinomycetota bacterium]